MPIRASWSPTCIGRSLDELVRAPDGGLKAFVHTLSAAKGRGARGTCSIPHDLPIQSAAPKQLFTLTEAAVAWTERALADEQMMLEGSSKLPRSAGWPFDPASWKLQDEGARKALMMQVLDTLDNDKPLAEAFAPETCSRERLEVVCEALLLFLRALTDGIVTAALWARLEQASLPSLGLGAPTAKQPAQEAAEDDKTAILDLLAAAPNHNVAFVFLTSTLARVVADLAPLGKTDADRNRAGAPVTVTATATGGIAGFGRRSLTFARSLGGGAGAGAGARFGASSPEASVAMEQRRAKEKRVAEIFGPVVCRAPRPEKEKDRRVLEDRQRALLELFLRRKGDC
ncbi:hypothetical protein P8C59_003756 [Phyllachora maydis]|nr:hypothetical protein P8C59_003756 [Phyllachora maydis]